MGYYCHCPCRRFRLLLRSIANRGVVSIGYIDDCTVSTAAVPRFQPVSGQNMPPAAVAALTALFGLSAACLIYTCLVVYICSCTFVQCSRRMLTTMAEPAFVHIGRLSALVDVFHLRRTRFGGLLHVAIVPGR